MTRFYVTHSAAVNVYIRHCDCRFCLPVDKTGYYTTPPHSNVGGIKHCCSLTRLCIFCLMPLVKKMVHFRAVVTTEH